MPYRRSIGAVIIVVMAAFATFASSMTMTSARVFDESKTPGRREWDTKAAGSK